jgi:DNA-binding beta-propeller fold protein YncE
MSAFAPACGQDDLLMHAPDQAERTIPDPGVSQRTEPPPPYTLFEAGPVRPVAVLASGLVAVANVPDDRVELFRPGSHGITHCGSVRVGMRPVALNVVGDQLWVVNHLSDSVNVVEVDEARCAARVVRTLAVGDEPRDVVSAPGRAGERYAFITAAHRGQNVRDATGTPRDPELTRPGIGRADVFVYRADRLGPMGSERPVEILTLFTDSPRALAVGNNKVYAAGFLSGNQTSLVRYQLVVDRGRQSLRKLDADRDLQIDPGLPESARVIEGGYPAIKGHGRCIASALTTTNVPAATGNDFWMDVCVRTDPAAPDRALEIIPQNTGRVSPACSCTNSAGEMQTTPPIIVRFYESAAACGGHFSQALGGCWLEPPQEEAELPRPGATGPLRMQAWNDQVALSLPDRDVFTIDMTRSPPALVQGGDFRHVGTTLFNMAVHPKTGEIFVSNTEARNDVRFEGPGGGVTQDARYAGTSVRGHIAESRITLLGPSDHAVKPVHLNAHIDYATCCAPAPNAESERSLAFPVGLAISRKRDRFGRLVDDQDLYVAALGSDKVAVLSTSRLEHAAPGQAIQDQRDHIEIAGGPVGLELDEARDRLYVLAWFTNELVVVDTRSRTVIERHHMFSPEPTSIVEGRPLLYSARRTSSHGDSACASCHIFGDFDGLSWDLGAPDDHDLANLGPFFTRPETLTFPKVSRFLSVKGPMATQSLRGMANHGAMHWRGDRRDRTSTVNAQPDTGAFDEDAAFKAFNVAFAGLLGRATQLTTEDMQKFTDFALALTYPPNPIRQIDDALTAGQQRARDHYFGCGITDESMARGECADGRNIARETLACNCADGPDFRSGEPACPANPVCTLAVNDVFTTCNGCHRLDPDANAEFGVARPGMFGSNGIYTDDGVSHVMKIPHLRNLYQKVGMFGSMRVPAGIGISELGDSIFGPRAGGLVASRNAATGDQVRGFGFTHAGEDDTLFHFLSAPGFIKGVSFFPGIPDNSGAFDPALPREPKACYDGQLAPLNQQFLARLAPLEVRQQLAQQVIAFTSPASTAEQRAAALQAISAVIAGLPASNPGAVFQRLPAEIAASQLRLPLLACPALPPADTLQSLGCFELHTGAGCAALVQDVRSCAVWGATLEQVLSSGTDACHASGLDDRADMESFLLAFDSNLKPVVGQQITVTRGSGSELRSRLQLLIGQAARGNCDLVAHAGADSFVYSNGVFIGADGASYELARLELREVAAGPLTFTAVPPGEGTRSRIDQ